MRVIAGKYRGRKLQTPPDGQVRPTLGRVREALFSMLGDLTDLRVLDLFAGSGALGIEALSRGAKEAVFVDNNQTACDFLRRNIQEIGLEDSSRVVQMDALSFLTEQVRGGGRYDLVLVDPPYGDAIKLAKGLDPLLQAVLLDDARVVCESDHRNLLKIETLKPIKERRYGSTALTIYVKSSDNI